MTIVKGPIAAPALLLALGIGSATAQQAFNPAANFSSGGSERESNGSSLQQGTDCYPGLTAYDPVCLQPGDVLCHCSEAVMRSTSGKAQRRLLCTRDSTGALREIRVAAKSCEAIRKLPRPN